MSVSIENVKEATRRRSSCSVCNRSRTRGSDWARLDERKVQLDSDCGEKMADEEEEQDGPIGGAALR